MNNKERNGTHVNENEINKVATKHKPHGRRGLRRPRYRWKVNWRVP
jgi:hypothetical protein